MKEVGRWRLRLWVPTTLHDVEKSGVRAFKERQLPLALAEKELAACEVEEFGEQNARLICENFLQALSAMEARQFAAVLPDFLNPQATSKRYLRVPMAGIDSRLFHFRLAWNPRLFRLNPHAVRRRDFLVEALAGQMREIGG